MEGFWKSVARIVPRDPEDMRILNPYFIQEAAFKFIGLPLNKGLMGRGVRHKHNNHLSSQFMRNPAFIAFKVGAIAR